MTPLILALDTTHEHGSIALGGRLSEEEALHEPGGFSRILFDCIARLLERHALKVADIDCFAAAAGPGSFTGVRVGLACVKGLAEALQKPAFGVSNLQAMARFGTAPLRAVALDARRGEIYGAVYDAAGSLVSPEVVAPLDSWLASLPAGIAEFICSGVTPPLPPGSLLVTPPHALAAVIAHVAAERLARGDSGDPAAIDANYVRRSDAELFGPR
ncbi:MAG TPA: tRNA (adenosine(37)-N6)-threonylcarbamoyltransferase complex dimerization subunit type 1 TsaB [Candidatus Acidoferrales bacterium]|nr:tRNA (adenosine(37)-N6)-threonylcarbamoyltransferase complex dimerization subunit type 1 TsaB [Candidatus Acidoferrales bacterium]